MADDGSAEKVSDEPLRYRDADLQDFEFVLCYKAHACLGIAAWQPDNSLVFQKSETFAEREENWAAAEAVLLHGLFVSAKAQGCGIGSLLLDELTRLARQKRFAGIFVRAERFSTGFFEQKGFRLLRRRGSTRLAAGKLSSPLLDGDKRLRFKVNRTLGGWRGRRVERRARHPDGSLKFSG